MDAATGERMHEPREEGEVTRAWNRCVASGRVMGTK